MYKAIYREYRPEVFSSMLGQEHIVRILQSQIASDTVNHAYLFCGTRGTGKTTTARLLAKAVNCLSEGEKPCGKCANCRAVADGSFVDLIELDAASNNGVEAIRNIRDGVEYAPAVGRRKVYIIDEVHMLSTQAFNALLKTLEEPPKTAMFILCTTEPEKLPATILSRCMRMDFRRVSETRLVEAMEKICGDKGVHLDEGSLRLIAANADGSVRDGLTLLEQCIAGRHGEIQREEVLDSLGAAGEEAYVELTRCVIEHDTAGGLLAIAKLLERGLDPRQLLRGWMNHYRNLMLAKFIHKLADILNMSLENVDRVRQQAELLSMEEIDRAVVSIAGTLEETRLASRPRILLEVCFVRLSSTTPEGAAPVYRRRRPAGEKSPQTEKPKEANATDPAASSLSSPRTVPGGAQEADLPDEAPSAAGAESASQASSDRKAPAAASAPAEDRDYMEEVWRTAVENAEKKLGGMFGLVRQNVIPCRMNDSEFVVLAKGMAKEMLKQHLQEMEAFIEQACGSHRRLMIREEDAPAREGAEPTGEEEIAEQICQTLGIDHVDLVDE